MEEKNRKLTEIIRNDLKKAMKSKDKRRINTLRMLLNSLTNAELEKREELSEEKELAVIASYAKKRRESIEEYKKGGREDLVKEETEELNIVIDYMPDQLSEDEIKEEAMKVIRDIGAEGPGEMGRVMGVMMSRLKGRADGKVVNSVVSGILKG